MIIPREKGRREKGNGYWFLVRFRPFEDQRFTHCDEKK